MSISEMMAKDPKPKQPQAGLYHDIECWVEREISLGGQPVPDFWGECDTSERLAMFLTNKGWVRKDGSADLAVALAISRQTIAKGMNIVTDLQTKADWCENKLAASDQALIDIRTITGQTHTGQLRAFTALSQIDQIARKALA